MDNIFKDIKIVELANVLAGPAVGMFFAELGAQVIKIENSTSGGDLTRKWKLPEEDQQSPVSAYYSSVNWGKQTVMANLSNEQDRKNIHELITDADIVISNYKPGDAEKFLMDYHNLKQKNPNLIYAHLSGFGSESGRTAFDAIVQAESGFMYMNGTSESGPVKMPVALMDILAAHQLKEAILVAMIKRWKTGKGCFIKTSLIESAVASLANQASNWLMAGHIAERMGTLHPNIAPYGEVIRTKDNKEIVLAVGTDIQFKKLCTVVGNTDLSTDKRFATNQLRVKNRSALNSYLTELIGKFDRDVLLAKLHKQNVPAGAILNIKDVFSHKPATEMILEENIDGVPTKRVKTIAWSIED